MEKRLDAAMKKVEKQEKQLKDKDESLQSANKVPKNFTCRDNVCHKILTNSVTLPTMNSNLIQCKCP